MRATDPPHRASFLLFSPSCDPSLATLQWIVSLTRLLRSAAVFPWLLGRQRCSNGNSPEEQPQSRSLADIIPQPNKRSERPAVLGLSARFRPTRGTGHRFLSLHWVVGRVQIYSGVSSISAQSAKAGIPRHNATQSKDIAECDTPRTDGTGTYSRYVILHPQPPTCQDIDSLLSNTADATNTVHQ